MAEILEAAMLLSFGFSWPINFRKAYKAGNTKGTSILFLFLIEAGYLCGIASKILSGHITYVLFFYLINLVTVMANIILYYVNRRKERGKESLILE